MLNCAVSPASPIRRQFWLAALMLACVSSCAKPDDKKVEGEPVDRPEIAIGLDTTLESANDYLSIRGLAAFVPGRSKTAILNDLHWRGALLGACEHEGGAVLAIQYRLLSDSTDKGGVGVDAIFVDEEFVKFVPIETAKQLGMTQDDPDGLYDFVLKPRRLDDCRWLVQHVRHESVSVDELKKELKSKSPTPQHIDIGLTIAWLLLRSSRMGPSEADLKRNAILRNQFNASRLKIGMTPAEVASTLKAPPLETGNAGGAIYRIYGSNEFFNFPFNHFYNTLVPFREGKASVCYVSS